MENSASETQSDAEDIPQISLQEMLDDLHLEDEEMLETAWGFCYQLHEN